MEWDGSTCGSGLSTGGVLHSLFSDPYLHN